MRSLPGLFPRCLVAAALLSAAALASPASAADHKDSPSVDERPPADINDVYMFRRGGKLVLGMTVNGVSDRDFNGAYNFSPDVLYRFAFDKTGDGDFEKTIDVTFSALDAGEQEYTARFPGGIRVKGLATRPTTLTDKPPLPVITDHSGGIRVFAGQRDDPFFFDLVGFNRFVATLRLNQFRGEDSFAGLNVSVIAIELPVSLVAGGARRLGLTGFTYVLANAVRSEKGTPTVTFEGKRYEQFDRMGNPAVNTAFVPPPLKDQFNHSLPKNDARDFGDAILGMLKYYGTPEQDVKIITSVALPDTLKLDLSQPDGFPNGRRPEDDVIDTLLSLIVGRPAGDGVDRNDEKFLDRFPYFAPPHQPQG